MTDKIERLSNRELEELEGLIAQSEHQDLVHGDMRIEYGSESMEAMRAAWDAMQDRNRLVSAAMRALPALLAEIRAARG